MEKNALKLFDNKIVLFSQRMDYVASHHEWRDTIDQRISRWIENLGGIPVGMPNDLQKPLDYVNRIKPEIIILTGGNTVSSSLYDSEGKQEKTYARDLTEQYLLNYAIEHSSPLIGICRGFQMIHVYFGGSLNKCTNHIATRHKIRLMENRNEYEVNSYHGQAVLNEGITSDFKIVAISQDNIIEATIHKKYPILGVQWHPEREESLKELDMRLVHCLLEGRL